MLQDKLCDKPSATEKRALEDALLLRKAQSGEPEAMERLLSPHQRALYGLCRNMLGNTTDAEDAVQETFLYAIRSLPGFRGNAEIKTWLYRIAINLCLKERRRRSRQVPLETAPDQALQIPSLEHITFTRARVDAALASLLPRHRAVFLLREWEGWSIAEIAAVLHCTTRRVHNELYHARRILLIWAQQEGEES